MAKVRKGKLFSLFEKDYKITFFYKPSSTYEDQFYYIILDDVVRLTIRLFNNIVLVVHDITPMTEAYMSKYYDKLISFLINQTMFTVLISRFGNTSCINDSCIKLNVPTVDDDRFITIPKNLYDLYKKKLNDVNKHGFYVLAVTEDMPTAVVKETTKPKPIEVIKPKEVIPEDTSPAAPLVSHLSKHLRTRTITKHESEDSPVIDLTIDNGINMRITVEETCIRIKDIGMSHTVSLVELMSIFEALEKFDTDIYVDDIRDINVFKLCQTRQYQKINDLTHVRRVRADQFGTYKIVKLQ